MCSTPSTRSASSFPFHHLRCLLRNIKSKDFWGGGFKHQKSTPFHFSIKYYISEPISMMTRELLTTRIIGSLAKLESYLKLKSAQNLNDPAVLAEDLCKRLLNQLYGYNLTNLNTEEPNAPAVDLCDRDRRLSVQV